jgi:DeoR family myo-inositol catabolism operon transcriptional repressor
MEGKKMRIDRLSEMESYIIKNGSVSLDEMAENFGLSLNTIRRDVEELLTRGNIKKVYGGVTAVSGENILFTNRENKNKSAKQIIGSLAAELIENNSTVYIDTGTTTAQVVSNLGNKSGVTIITNSLKVMCEAGKSPELNLLTLGGYYNYATASFIDSKLIEKMSKLHFDYVFLGASSISKNGLAINSYFELDKKQWLVKNNKGRIVLLADTNKYDTTALYLFSDFNEVDIVIAEAPLPEPYMEIMNENHIKFICPEKSE